MATQTTKKKKLEIQDVPAETPAPVEPAPAWSEDQIAAIGSLSQQKSLRKAPAPEVVDDPLPGQEEEPPPAVKAEAFVRTHTGGGMRALTAFQAGAVVGKAAPEDRDELRRQIIAARPDLSSVFDQEEPPKKAKKNEIKLPGMAGKYTPTAEEELIAEKNPNGQQVIVDGAVIEPKKSAAAALAEKLGAVEPNGPDKPSKPTPAPGPAPVPTPVPAAAGFVPADTMIPIGELHPSPTNPRKRFDPKKLEELAASLLSLGVLQPLLVRRDANGFEIVAGERRYRAAKIAGLKELPARVRSLSDLEVLEAQLVENGQREDLTELEEADTYAKLHKDHGYSVELIAQRTGKTRATVYARMKLATLSKKGRELLESGKLPASHALLIARIPGEKLQALAISELIERDEVPGFRWFAGEIARRFTLDLHSATFDTKDEFLLAGVDQAPELYEGACGPCPFRSGNCRELTPDIASADVCTSPKCFEAKTRASAAAKLEKLAAAGVKALPKAEAKTLFAFGDELHHSAPFVEIHKPHPDDPKKRTWAQLLAKAEKQEGTTVERRAVPAPSGKVLEVVDRKEASRLIRKLEGSKVAEKVVEDETAKEERKKEEAARQVRNFVAAKLLELVAAHAEKKNALPDLVVESIAARAAFDFGDDSSEELALRRYGAKDANDLGTMIEKKKLEPRQLIGLVTIAELGHDFAENFGSYSPSVRAAAKLLDFDLRAQEKEAKNLIAAELEREKERKKAAKSA